MAIVQSVTCEGTRCGFCGTMQDVRYSLPQPTVGRGACEVRVRDQAGAFRVVYVAKFEDAVYVLHAFQKKSRKTSPADLKLARQRYRDARELTKGTNRGQESD